VPRDLSTCMASLLPRLARRRADPSGAVMGRRSGDRRRGDAPEPKALDEGPVLASETLRIGALDTAGAVHDRMAAIGAETFWPRHCERIEAGTAGPSECRPRTGVTYAKKNPGPKEAKIDWDKPGAEVDRKIRGLSPFPGAWFLLPTDKGPVRVKAPAHRPSRDAEGRRGPGAGRPAAGGDRPGPPLRLLARASAKGRGAAGRPRSFLRGQAIAARNGASGLMPRYRLLLEYDGGALQRLPGPGRPADGAGLAGAGGEGPFCRRRDPRPRPPGAPTTGVHALGQVAAHRSREGLARPRRLRNALNAHLRPEPIVVLDAEVRGGRTGQRTVLGHRSGATATASLTARAQPGLGAGPRLGT